MTRRGGPQGPHTTLIGRRHPEDIESLKARMTTALDPVLNPSPSPRRKGSNIPVPQALEGGKFRTDREIVDLKAKIINILVEGQAKTIKDAALIAGVNPVVAWSWAQHDKTFKQCLDAVHQVVADGLESQLREEKNFIPLMFLLKGYRPEFRENAKIEIKSEGVEKLLAELAEIARRVNTQAKVSPALPEGTTTVTVESKS